MIHDDIAAADAGSALRRILAFDAFRRAPSRAKLLVYLCERAIDGRTTTTEYDIAFDLLNRPPDFDPATDSRVRVEAHRLRKRLAEYYESEGADDPIEIVLPPGQYTPEFRRRSGSVPPPRDPVPEECITAPVPLDAATSPPPIAHAAAAPRRSFLALAVVLLTTVLHGGFAPPEPNVRAESPPDAAVRDAALPSTQAGAIRLLAGATVGQYVDGLGQAWGPDAYFEGGSARAQPDPVFGGVDPFLFRRRREGDFSYRIPLAPGRYRLHLHFSEPQFGQGSRAGGGEGTRIFDVRLNGERLLTNLDVLNDAGGTNIAVEKVFDGIAPAADGRVHLEFKAVARGLPVLNALAIVPAPTPGVPPIRIVAQATTSYVDASGRFWGADRYFVGGQVVTREEYVEGDAPNLFRGERYGNFTYAIPVTPGRYTATLRFAEQWFGLTGPFEAGVGRRLFNVFANGRPLLERFDIFAEACGARREVVKVFHHLEPDAQNRLVFSFQPIANYAVINTIEIEPEGPRR
jgi:hypothetical protein